MKIDRLSCTQFAGIHDLTISFESGINVLLGNNESGKSTIVDLIYQLLYHDVDEKQNGKSEKVFRARYYPKGIDFQGDFIEGSIVFNSAGEKYTLQKGWGESAYVQLTTPQDIRIRSQESVNKMLGELLKYRKGLYDDIVFAPQRKQEELIAHLFQSIAQSKKTASKDPSNTKSDLVSIIAQETIKNAGVDANVFERQLGQIIDAFEGCWDTKKDCPKATSLRTKRNGDRPKNEGKLFQAFFAVDQLTQMLTDAQKAEMAVDRDLKELNSLQKKLNTAEEKREQFEVYATQLAELNANKQLIERLKEDIKRRRQAAKDYPGLLRAFSKASKLRQELREVEALELYDSIAEKHAEWEKAKKWVDSLQIITKNDIQQAERLEKSIQLMKQEQFGMNILAQLINIGVPRIEIRSLADNKLIKSIYLGEKIDEFDILEPVEIVVPDRFKLLISNRTHGFKGEKHSAKYYSYELDRLYMKFGIYYGGIEKLQEKKEEYDSAVINLDRKAAVFNTALGNRDWSVMVQTHNNLSKRKKRRPLIEIKADIKDAFGEQSIESYCGELGASIKAIEDAYKEELGEISPSALRASVILCQEQLQSASDAVKKVDGIPSFYKRIKDVSQYRGQLISDVNAVRTKMDEVEARLQENQKSLGKKTAEEYAIELEKATTELARVRELYHHWLHIQETFRTVRNKAGDSSEMQDVERRFAEYLKLITGGRVVLHSLDENMDVNITSNHCQLDEVILSEGTKDTIALAFRLAMLEHVFPNGGGFLVLDDPFTDMDKTRTQKACQLVKSFAGKGNQVIFATCNEIVAEQLGGNHIHFN